MFLDPIMRSIAKRDLKGAEPKTAVATVVVLAIPDRLHTEGAAKTHCAVRFNGKIYTVPNTYTAEALHVGGPVLILYRVGKSGRIVVDSAEPVPPDQKTNDMSQPHANL